jgi:hypothetical protein
MTFDRATPSRRLPFAEVAVALLLGALSATPLAAQRSRAERPRD